VGLIKGIGTHSQDILGVGGKWMQWKIPKYKMTQLIGIPYSSSNLFIVHPIYPQWVTIGSRMIGKQWNMEFLGWIW
jgi:hypothetical protein